MTSQRSDKGSDEGAGKADIGGRYARYVLAVLTAVYVFNFLDRQILSILAEDIKADLGLDDAQLGFLYGTAFAAFYAVFGIPLARLADVWNRRSLISIGLAFWSSMTAVSGLAYSFVHITLLRIGFGIGAASASPAAYSILSDYFSPARRATALAFYAGGIYIGIGLSLMLGGHIVEYWNARWPAGAAPLGLAGWQVVFLAAGLPGLFLAIWVRTLREPRRGQSEGLYSPDEPHPFRQFFVEIRSVLPPLTVFHLWLMGGTVTAIPINLTAAAGIAGIAYGMVVVTGDTAQWLALGISTYAAMSWMQALGLRDRPTSVLILRTRALRHAILGFSFLSFSGYGLGFWVTPYFLRVHTVGLAELGFWMGGCKALGGWIGITMGGILADRLHRRWVAGRLHVALINATMPVPFALWLLSTGNIQLGYFLFFLVSVFSAMRIGAAVSTVQDLVLPRMRASAAAFFLLVNTLIGLALGPYVIGKLSVVTGSLRTGIILGLSANVVAMVFLLLAVRDLNREDKTLMERARAAGETKTTIVGQGV
ncbi:MAG: MFS transporter [Proteobacteria bacterium]|nr:MFS transporter [Pseudomonadota bacterium]